MRETGRIGTLAATLAAFALTACVYASAGVETFSIRSETGGIPVAETRSASLSVALHPTEIAYARDTARVLFRRRDGERTTRFVSADPDEGYALCLRAAGEYALLLFQRRMVEAAISQAADDAVILRSAADTAPCRTAEDWVRV